jgi:uncharacterized protein YqhQ
MKQKQKPNFCSIGGQALLEGVMMRGPKGYAMAVRKEDGTIIKKFEDYIDPTKKNKFLGLPIVRGCVSFVESLRIGMKTLTYSANVLELEEEEPSKFEKWLSRKLGKGVDQIVIGVAMVLAVALAALLFFVLPTFLGSLVSKFLHGSVLITNLLEGLIRVAIFIVYLAAVSRMKDIQRTFMYHGAEHKTIACYEAGLELTPENAGRMKRFHPRCGTNYLFLVMAVSILFFALVGFNGHWAIKALIRIICLPLVAGLSYEVLKAAAKSNSLLARIARWPGLQLQRLTTKEPTEDMLEVAIVAFKGALDPSTMEEEPIPCEQSAKEQECSCQAEQA